MATRPKDAAVSPRDTIFIFGTKMAGTAISEIGLSKPPGPQARDVSI